MEGKRTIESSGQQITEHSKLGGNFTKTAKPQFIEQRYICRNAASNCSPRLKNDKKKS